METKVLKMNEAATCEFIFMGKVPRAELNEKAVNALVSDIMGYAAEFRTAAGVHPDDSEEFKNLIKDSNKMIDAAATICALFYHCPKKWRV